MTDDYSALLTGGGAISAIAVVVIALIRGRLSDRATILRFGTEHMARLTDERTEAVKDRDTAYDEAEGWRGRFEIEVRLRVETETRALKAEAALASMTDHMTELTAKVSALQEEVAHLSRRVGTRATDVPAVILPERRAT